MQEYFNHIEQGFAILQQLSDIQYEYNSRELVFECDMVKLYHYQPKIKKTHATPTLVVFATVNRPEILDLFPDASFIGGLLEKGTDVYLLDWGYPKAEDKNISINNYVTKYIHQCVRFIQKKQDKKINLVGVCQGGLLCLCYAIIYQNIKNLVLISTPVDFQTHDNTISKLLNTIDIKTLADVSGNISGAALKQFFISMRPFELVGKKYLQLIDHINDEVWLKKFLRVEKWLHDAPDQSGDAFVELINNFYQKNKLITNEIVLDGKKVELNKLTIPVLNVIARKDEIVPASASRPLKKYIGSSDYSQKIFPSGHIGIYVSEKVGNRMSKAVASWLQKRDR